MNSTKFIALAILSTSLFFGCKQNAENQISKHYKKENAPFAQDTAAPQIPISSIAAVENPNDTLHKFIRTADIKAKVSNTIFATYMLENEVNRASGFVTYTNLQSNIQSTNETNISNDSTQITTQFAVINTLTIRVPNIKLDTFLKAIAPLMAFIDHRIIEAEDVKLQMFANTRKQQHLAKYEKQLNNTINKENKTSKVIEAGNELVNSTQEADNRYFENLSLNDKIQFSTLNIYLYQNPQVKTETIAQVKIPQAYNPSFTSKMGASLKRGWIIFEDLFAGLLNLWPIFILAVFGYFIYKNYTSRSKLLPK